MLSLIYLVREFETALLELKDADLVHGPVHASIGQEAVAAGVATAPNRSDLVASTHRAHGHFLAKALEYCGPEDYDPREQAFNARMQWVVNRTLAEIMGLREGWCGGRGGSMHLYDAQSGNLGSNAIVGGGISIATGVALAQRLQCHDRVAVSVFGDGAYNQGCFQRLPTWPRCGRCRCCTWWRITCTPWALARASRPVLRTWRGAASATGSTA
jgi:2-oxoisovalerate dehydrogenase E1 component